MVLRQRLDQRQVQKLILAPALQQAIKLLPLTNLELIEIIDTELSENPMLEFEEDTEEKSPEEGTEGKEKESADAEKEPEASQEISEADEVFDSQREEENAEFESYFQEYFDDGFRPVFQETKEAPSLENVVSESTTLWDHLNWQANLTFFNEKDKEIAQYIIGNINEDGYLTTSEEEIAETLSVSVKKVNEIREKIKGFDPISIDTIATQIMGFNAGLIRDLKRGSELQKYHLTDNNAPIQVESNKTEWQPSIQKGTDLGFRPHYAWESYLGRKL